ncbi:MAG: AMIN-like domain-containing (lipo)protein [Nocardioidaceae bacterium]
MTPGPQSPGRCADETGTWNTAAESASEYSQSALYNSRIGQHGCYDRVVFDINGSDPVGYDVRYVPLVSEDGSGIPVPVAGDAVLQVVVHAPAQGSPGDESGHQPGVVFAPNGARLHGPGVLENWGCLREVRSAGSFEGQTTLAIGVRDKLPFRVDTWTDSNQTTHVTVDIACQ